MKGKRTNLTLLGISLASFGVLSISFLLMPIEPLGVLPGILFWLGLIIGVSLQIVLEKKRKAFFAKYNMKPTRMQRPRNGLLTFGANKVALVVDCVMGADVIATTLVFILTKGTGYLCYVCLAVLAWSFCAHCILNGRNCFHAINEEKIRQVLENKKESTTKKEREKDGKYKFSR